MTTNNLAPIFDALPQDAADILSDMGVTSVQFDGLLHVSFGDVLHAVLGVFRDGLHTPLAFLSAGCSVLVLLAVFGALGRPDGKPAAIRTWVAALFLIAVCAVPLHTVLQDAVAALRTCSAFLCTLIPILAAVIAGAGNPVLSVVWHAAVFSAAETVSAAAYGCMAPCCGLMAGIGVLDSLLPQMSFGKLAEQIRKTAVRLFSALATMFTAFLTLKGVLAGAADTLAAKGIKLAVSSLIPVVGAQLSEAYASVVGSLAAVRATAGVLAIAGVCALMLPAAAQLLLWLASLRLLRTASGLLGLRHAESLFAAFASSLSVLHACLLFVTVLYVLCLGIIFTIKAGV